MTDEPRRPGLAAIEQELEGLYRSAARRLWHEEGSIEVDEAAAVSLSEDGGAYVQAWVWVPRKGLDAGSPA